jgi:hypothetical protein
MGWNDSPFPCSKSLMLGGLTDPKVGPNFFHVRVLTPDGQGEHLYHHFPQRLVTVVGQPV